MTWLLAFALGLVAMVAAHAGESAPRDGPSITAEIESPRFAVPPLLERLQPSAAPLIPDAPVKSNPLWSIPLSALSETRDRPLFSATRRSPASVVAMPVSKVGADDKAPEPDQPPFALVGTIVSSSARIAVLLDPTTSLVKQLRQGKSDSGWTVLSVGARSIVLQRGELLRTVALPGPTAARAKTITNGDVR